MSLTGRARMPLTAFLATKPALFARAVDLRGFIVLLVLITTGLLIVGPEVRGLGG